MSDHHDDDLGALDEHARRAARGLRDHVLQRVDPDAAMRATAAAPRSRHRVVAVAAALLLITGSVALLDQRRDDGSTRVDIDEALPDVEPGVLRPLGPRDGRDSIQLPVTADPSTDLAEGTTVTVAGTGFVPGERVGIVQCAREAGGDSAEVRGGVDGCNVGGVQYADADAEGLASGTIDVRRVLTTPITGTVDCAAEAERCIVAMGALNDYDRSGGTPLTFAGGGDPLELPTRSGAPTSDLDHGDLVRLSGAGFAPGALVDISVCAIDQQGCWMTGEEVGLTSADQRGEGKALGTRVDDRGRIDVEVPVWRFLPGLEPGTYIDCAVTRCSLRLTGPPIVPAPIELGFSSDGEPPVAPALAVSPTEGLAPGDEITVRGAGFRPGAHVYLQFCGGPAGSPDLRYTCAAEDPDIVADDEGTFTVELEVPELGSVEMATATTACAGDGCDPGCADGCDTAVVKVRCDGVETECAVYADAFEEGTVLTPPSWSPRSVAIRFR